MANPELPQSMHDDLRAAWLRYIDLTSSFRPDLHRYCGRLTRDLWDAEDLLQETLLRAFATLGAVNGTIQNPRGYLVRTATHLWVDTLRRRNTEAAALSMHASSAGGAKSAIQPPVEVHDAGQAVFGHLAPKNEQR